MNAYTAENAGEDVVERHSEEASGTRRSTSSSRAEQLRAGRRALDAPAGTIVFLRDPTVRRYATAAEPHTTVLAVGKARRRTRRVGVVLRAERSEPVRPRRPCD
jgi:hypothetical protein